MPEPRNLITDIAGLMVGNAHDPAGMTGVSVVLPQRPVTAAVDVRGGGPGTRETDALGLAGAVGEVHGLVLSGGSAFGLDAGGSVQRWLSQRGVGFAVGTARVPIVPQAVLFDLTNGGDKNWGMEPPYARLALEACASASSSFPLGSTGAGYGATTANCRGGLGSCSAHLDDGVIVGVLVAVNAVGAVTIGDGPHFWGAPFERNREFGGLRFDGDWAPAATAIRLKGASATPSDQTSAPPNNTTIAVVATNARLDRAGCHRLAVMAQTGMARAVYPVHTPLDGDTVFALSTGEVAAPQTHVCLARIGAEAANCLSRAIARAVYEAAAVPSGWMGPPAYRTRFPEGFR